VLRLQLAVRLLVVLPLWALGTVLLAAAGAAGALLSPLLSRIALCALLLALLAGAFVTAAKTVFPDLPLKKVLRRRNLAALLLGASALTVVDAVLPLLWEEYGQVRGVVLSVGFFAALSCVTLSFALREQRRRLSAPPAPAKQPDSLLFTDGLETYRVRLGERAGSN
ncbi:MAG: hypothetical protein K6G54_03820, partial [Oscillospiraceae bacterium]|nr:hypothetical protein [Oscillospiraceae bacterium]